MFDLFRSQKQAVRLLLGGILLLVAASMVITLIPGLSSRTSSANLNDPVLAEVDGEPVTIQNVQGRLRDYQMTGQIPPESLAFLAAQTVETLITDQVLMEEAKLLGLIPTEQELAERIRTQLAPLFQQGGLQAYQNFVQQRFQRSIPEFEQGVMRDWVIELRLKHLATDSVLISDEEMKRDYKLRNDKVQIEYVKVLAGSFQSRVQPDETKIKAYFEQNKSRYRTQESRSVQAMTVRIGALPAPQVSEAELRDYFNRNLTRFQVEERIRASHILFMTMEKPEADVKQIEAKAKEVLEKVKAGADFAALAKQYSDDPGTKEKGGDLGWVVRGQMVAGFEQASFALQPGQISDLVKTEYGYHIIKVHERQQSHMQSFDDVKEQIRQEIAEQQQQNQRLAKMDEAVAVANKYGKDLAAAAKELGVPVQTYENVTRFAVPPGLQASPTLLSSLFSASEGEVVSEAAENGTLLAVVTAINPARVPEFDEVRERATQEWVLHEAGELARQHAQELADKARQAGGNLKQLAAQEGLQPKASDFITRAGTIPDLGGAQLLGDAAFTQELGTIGGPVATGPDFAVYRVAARQDADMTRFYDERDKLREQQLDAKRDEMYEIYKGITRQRYEDAGKIRRHQSRIDAYLQSLARRG